MMDPSEINSFENQWKKAFNEASETPPPSVWKGIEVRLDQDENDKIIPLWWRSPKVWYAAASIVALLLVGGGIWYNSRNGLIINEPHTEVAANKPSSRPTEKANPESSSHEKTWIPKDTAEPSVAANSNRADSEGKKKKLNREADSQTGVGNAERVAVTASKTGISGKKGSAAGTAESERGFSASGKVNEKQSTLPEKAEVAVSSDANTENNVSKQVNAMDDILKSGIEDGEAIALRTFQADLLTPVPYSDLDVFMQKRYVFFQAAKQPKAETADAKKPKEYWAALGFMPASFNPDVQIKEAPAAFASQLNSRQKSLTGSNKAGASYAVQTQGGLRLSKHWSMEMGVNYLKGNSRYEGGGYVLSAYNNASSNVLEEALTGLAANSDKYANTPTLGASNALYIDVNKNVSNDYQYLQLPVQAGFTLNPDKKLSYSVLGGMMANFFLSNELESASGEIITTKASDDIYRSMNWAATTGLRFNYRLSSKWKASLTGSYQKALTSGFRTNQGLEAHPYLYGVSWGVRYSF